MCDINVFMLERTWIKTYTFIVANKHVIQNRLHERSIYPVNMLIDAILVLHFKDGTKRPVIRIFLQVEGWKYFDWTSFHTSSVFTRHQFSHVISFHTSSLFTRHQFLHVISLQKWSVFTSDQFSQVISFSYFVPRDLHALKFCPPLTEKIKDA